MHVKEGLILPFCIIGSLVLLVNAFSHLTLIGRTVNRLTRWFYFVSVGLECNVENAWGVGGVNRMLKNYIWYSPSTVCNSNVAYKD